MGRARLPTTEQYNSGALHNVSLLLSLPNGCQEALLNIISPVLCWRICVVEGMHTTMKVTLCVWEGRKGEEGEGREGGEEEKKEKGGKEGRKRRRKGREEGKGRRGRQQKDINITTKD